MSYKKITFCLYIVSLCVQSLSAQTRSNTRPNVVLIMADDISWECFSTYGGTDYTTPNIDRLAQKGLQFNHCYSTPICTTSRVKMMTGKYNFRNYTPFGYLHPNEKTFANMLQESGYKTAIAGKWQLNGLYHNAERAKDNARPYEAGFDEYCLWQLTKPKKSSEDGGERFWSPPLEKNGTFLSKEDNKGKYGPDIMSDFLCDFIEKNKKHPFFIYYPTVLVHSPFVPTPDNIGDRPKTQEANKKVKHESKSKENFVAMVSYLDKIVGKIVHKLEEVDQLENTIVLFTADNGTNKKITSTWNGQKIVGGKATTRDMGTHVPLIVYWKGKTPQGVQNNDLIDFSDFYQTIADIANIKKKEKYTLDSKSFYPQIVGEKAQARKWQANHYQPYWLEINPAQYVRNQHYKLYRNQRLYKISDDLKEQNNRYNSTEQADVKALKELTEVIKRFPPSPKKEVGENVKERPLYADWNDLLSD